MAEDLARAESLVEHWVPQVSANFGDASTPEAIVQDHLAHREKYDAILVNGGMFNFVRDNHRMNGWYVSIVPKAFADAESANAWCDAEQIAWGDCFAHFITNRVDVPAPLNVFRKQP